uniref:Putative secreted protein n=1 Tax=Ixodes ricinus TaxID=34613 RepID=A0A6B0UFU5_IXORI
MVLGTCLQLVYLVSCAQLQARHPVAAIDLLRRASTCHCGPAKATFTSMLHVLARTWHRSRSCGCHCAFRPWIESGPEVTKTSKSQDSACRAVGYRDPGC